MKNKKYNYILWLLKPFMHLSIYAKKIEIKTEVAKNPFLKIPSYLGIWIKYKETFYLEFDFLRLFFMC